MSKLFTGGKKKADLSLSINSIVILILAITVLGLGLTFIRGLFKQAEAKTQSAFEATKLKKVPTSEEPISVDSPITMNPSNKKTIEIGIYNPQTGDPEQATLTGVKPDLVATDCVNSEGTKVENTNADWFKLAAASIDIPPREARGFPAILTIGNANIDTYICTIKAVCDPSPCPVDVSAQIFIEVKA